MFQFVRGFLLVTAMMLNCEAALAADVTSANYVMPGCRGFLTGARDDFIAVGICVGTVSTLVNVAPGICAPQSGTNEQSIRVVVQYIESRPARMHEHFMVLALQALRAAWPCKK